MPRGWEDNRRSGVALAMRHGLKWSTHLRAQRPRVGDEHPASPQLGHGSFYLYLYTLGHQSPVHKTYFQFQEFNKRLTSRCGAMGNVMTLDLLSRGHWFNSRSGHYQLAAIWMSDCLQTGSQFSLPSHRDSGFYPYRPTWWAQLAPSEQ